jgi:hypothetical protein
MNRKTLDEQIKLLNKRITENYDIIKKYEEVRKLLNKKELLDDELSNIMWNIQETYEENIVKDEDLRDRFIYELMK